MGSPLVTVALPIYNAERYLAEAVRSILGQTLRDIEVLAVLDGCTDRSEEILRSLADSRFVILPKEKNEGLVSGLNDCLSRASAPFWARMDADDVMLPERLARQSAFLNAHPDVDVLGTQFDYLDELSRPLRTAKSFPHSHRWIKEAFRYYTAVGHPTVMVRTEKLRMIGGYKAEFRQGEDIALWLECLAHGFRFANLPDLLLHYREYPLQNTQRRDHDVRRVTAEAYAHFGPQIWGKDSPVFGQRIRRRARRWRQFKMLLGLDP